MYILRMAKKYEVYTETIEGMETKQTTIIEPDGTCNWWKNNDEGCRFYRYAGYLDCKGNKNFCEKRIEERNG